MIELVVLLDTMSGVIVVDVNVELVATLEVEELG